MDLYNVTTRKKEVIDDEESLHNAILSGTHSFKKGSEVGVYSPDGTFGYVPAANLRDAIANGFTVETPRKQVIREYVKENKGLKGDIKVALGQFADEVAFGLPELIFNKKGDSLAVAKKEALKKDHELANTLGGITGFGAGLFTGAPLFKAATKVGEKVTANVAERLAAGATEEVGKRTFNKVAKDIVAKSAGMGAEGAVVSAPHAITESALGDPEAAAESLMMGMGVGMLFGSGGVMAKDFKKLASDIKIARGAREEVEQAIEKMPRLKRMEGEQYVKALNPTKSQSKELKEIFQTELDEELGELAGKNLSLGEVGQTLKKEGIFEGLPNYKMLDERIDRRSMELASSIGNKLDDIDAKFGEAVLVSRQAVAEKVLARWAKRKEANSTAFSKEFSGAEKELQTFLSSDVPLSLRAANQEKAFYQQKARETPKEMLTKKDLMADIHRGLNDVIREKIRLTAGDDALKSILDDQASLGVLNAAKKVSASTVDRDVANNFFGLNSFVSMVAGGSIAGLPGAIAGLTVREGARRYGNQLLAKSVDKVGGLLIAEQAMKKLAERVDKIPEGLKRLSQKERLPKVGASVSAIERLFGTAKDRVGAQPKPIEERNKDLDKTRTVIAELIANPERLTTAVSELSSPIGEAGAPNIGGALSMKYTSALTYLDQVIPKPPAPQNPFMPQYDWQPSDYELAEFERKLSVIVDPFTVLDELEQGTLTQDHMEALMAVYPGIHQFIVTRIYDEAVKNPIPLDYTSRLKLSLLLGSDLDPSLNPSSLSLYQNVSAINAMADDTQQEQGGFSADVNLAQQQQTQAQRIISK